MPLMPAIQQSANINSKAKTTATGMLMNKGHHFKLGVEPKGKAKLLDMVYKSNHFIIHYTVFLSCSFL